MTDPISATHQYLLAHYGPLMTLKHVAEVMHTTPNGLRMTLARRDQPLAVGLVAARKRLGRRIYFEARRVADLIDDDPRPRDFDSQAWAAPRVRRESRGAGR